VNLRWEKTGKFLSMVTKKIRYSLQIRKIRKNYKYGEEIRKRKYRGQQFAVPMWEDFLFNTYYIINPFMLGTLDSSCSKDSTRNLVSISLKTQLNIILLFDGKPQHFQKRIESVQNSRCVQNLGIEKKENERNHTHNRHQMGEMIFLCCLEIWRNGYKSQESPHGILHLTRRYIKLF